jgi:hypothetical protein
LSSYGIITSRHLVHLDDTHASGWRRAHNRSKKRAANDERPRSGRFGCVEHGAFR